MSTNSYDVRHQLATMNRSTGESHTYSYDGSGNLVQDYQLGVHPDIDYLIPANHNQIEHRVPSLGESILYQYDENAWRWLECPGGCVPQPDFRR